MTSIQRIVNSVYFVLLTENAALLDVEFQLHIPSFSQEHTFTLNEMEVLALPSLTKTWSLTWSTDVGLRESSPAMIKNTNEMLPVNINRTLTNSSVISAFNEPKYRYTQKKLQTNILFYSKLLFFCITPIMGRNNFLCAFDPLICIQSERCDKSS